MKETELIKNENHFIASNKIQGIYKKNLLEIISRRISFPQFFVFEMIMASFSCGLFLLSFLFKKSLKIKNLVPLSDRFLKN
jgi:hypothetical protein